MDKEILYIISDYKRKLDVLGVNIKKTILYGSYAIGNAREDSDIDLVVI